MKGYFENPERNLEAFDKQGWLKTGDVGYYTEKEFIFIVDRIKEIIKYNGFQVINNFFINRMYQVIHYFIENKFPRSRRKYFYSIYHTKVT